MISFLLIIVGVIFYLFIASIYGSLRKKLLSWLSAFFTNDTDSMEEIEDETRIYFNTAWDTNIESRQKVNTNQNSIKDNLRLKAIENAQPYIKVYNDDIWHNLILENRYCRLLLGSNGINISVFDTLDMTYSRYFEIIFNNDLEKSISVWNNFCFIFKENTNYQEMIEYCNTQNLKLKIYGENKIKPIQEETNTESRQERKEITPKEMPSDERSVDL